MFAGYMRKFGEMVFLYIVFRRNNVRVWRTHIQMNSETVPWVPIQSPIGGQTIICKITNGNAFGDSQKYKINSQKIFES